MDICEVYIYVHCCALLQRTAMHYNTLQRTATHCNTRNHEKRPADSLLTNVRTAVPRRQYLRCAEAYETCQQRFQKREKYVKRDVFVRKETCRRNSRYPHHNTLGVQWHTKHVRRDSFYVCVSFAGLFSYKQLSLTFCSLL